MVTGQVVQATRQRDGSTGAGRLVRGLPTKACASFRPHWSFAASEDEDEAGGLDGKAMAGGAVGVLGGGGGAGSGALEQEAASKPAIKTGITTDARRFMPASPNRVRRPGASMTPDARPS